MNKTVSTVGNKLTRMIHKTGFKLKKHSPEILIVTGGVSIVTGTILACKATLKVNDILDEHEETMQKIETAKEEKADVYSEKDAAKDELILKTQTAVKLVKNYIPSATLVIGGIVCMTAAYGIVRKRNVALMGAYKALETAFSDYRKRVIAEQGEEADNYYRYGMERIVDVHPDVEGKEGALQKGDIVVDGHTPSIYARFFDEASTCWSKEAFYNQTFLNTQQRIANDILHTKGFILLNEVYKMLGLPETKEGCIVGWLLSGDGDGYVDFGMYDVKRPAARDFVNGYERCVLLDFNVDGVIYDRI